MSLPDNFILAVCRKAKPYDFSTKSKDMKIGNRVYSIPSDYLCGNCNGTGCSQCMDTGLRTAADCRLS